jgi:hypothetical protein
MCKTKPNLGKLAYLGDETCGYCGAKHAKRTQFGGGPPGAECAKQTQFPASQVAGASRLCETNPIWPVSPDPGGRNAPNKPNSWRAGRLGPADYAKRTQFGRAAQTLESEMCQTNPIWKPSTALWRLQGGQAKGSGGSG